MAASCAGMMLYIVPMLLGRTYDIQKDIVGVDIFSKEDIDKATSKPIPHDTIVSEYTTVETALEKRNFMDIKGDLSVKIKAGLLSVQGSGAYLKDTTSTDNTIQILIKMTFKTQTVLMSPDTQPVSWWKTLPKESLGTHYVSSITYGGSVLGSLAIKVMRSEDFQQVRGEVQAALQKSGAFDVKAQAQMESLMKNISGRARTEITYFATVPLEGVATSLEGLRDLIHNFESHVRQVNNGQGVPLCVEMWSLARFDDKFNFIKNQVLMDVLTNTFDWKFENVRTAKAQLKKWVPTLPVTIDEEYEREVADFSDRVNKVLEKFYEVIGNLDLQQGPDQLSPANEAFDKYSSFVGPNKYVREFRALKQKLVIKDDPDDPLTIYTHWGARTCKQSAAKLLYIGFMASFVEHGIGGGTEYQCLPENPEWTDSEGESLGNNPSQMGGVKYKSLVVFKNKGKQVEGKVAACAVCEVRRRSTVKLFPLSTGCPRGWIEEYTGYMVSGQRMKMRGDRVCLEYDPDFYEVQNTISGEQVVMPIVLSPGVLNPNQFPDRKAVSCAVCSK